MLRGEVWVILQQSLKCGLKLENTSMPHFHLAILGNLNIYNIYTYIIHTCYLYIFYIYYIYIYIHVSISIRVGINDCYKLLPFALMGPR